ncbi:MAG: bifunctional tetrahydrofolate synthase/dihydrofolate synthase [Gammaproteobacteria bacterium]|nr:bifunctional tetrahydrofolate synthase/dihydrofolate synthase [Gammaproteobacteria bacterium]NIR96949.1 bifunctional tetrahydrofolate synthase/dihydrofolate synthase [Gammaproteobacteria bacterium]NIT62651.1 bifunctional tetrahydrofolate synthase/dihydrofolate synthase [Gammaproteobacteria bacterium]NIV19611.1 bifunctional tetrahydrofolate synthase/dihydrofolate synthase [Gammaproteobacteria bacterium]NIX10831.1 bifunctional tetrahydrofolate synthase/dihydrofolate synthase [Gammaproteobacter
MRFDTLNEWLAWQETLNPRTIDLGLERAGAVWERLRCGPPPFRVVTVAGTNGKGSCVAVLESILRAGGRRVGAYTSPHLLRYNERVRLDGREMSDGELCAAFERVDRARGGVPLTYFEFGTLAALSLFQDAAPEVILLEVGLGGRLDAVNIVDADVALVSSIGVDHVDWLGSDRDQIGLEKAGIFRPGRAAVCGDPDPPAALIGYAARLDAPLYLAGRDYRYWSGSARWSWEGLGRRHTVLPLSGLGGEIQLQNAAAVLAVVELLGLGVGEDALRAGLQAARLPGRLQVVGGEVTYVLDVAHNPDAARALACGLAPAACRGRTLAVLGMRADKDVAGVARALDERVDAWYAAGLPAPHGRSAALLAEDLRAAGVGGPVRACATVAEACETAALDAVAGDRIVVCGSFHTVAAALEAGL